MKSNNLSLNEAVAVAQNRPLRRLMSTFGAVTLLVVHVRKEEEEYMRTQHVDAYRNSRVPSCCSQHHATPTRRDTTCLGGQLSAGHWDQRSEHCQTCLIHTQQFHTLVTQLSSVARHLTIMTDRTVCNNNKVWMSTVMVSSSLISEIRADIITAIGRGCNHQHKYTFYRYSFLPRFLHLKNISECFFLQNMFPTYATRNHF